MKRIYILMTLCLLPLLASGQALKGSYFSENSVYRNKLNPAFVPRSSYLGFAAIDNLGFGITSNIGISNFLFPAGDGSLLTFMHPDVSSATFLDNMPSNPHLDIDLDTDILNVGFFTGKNSFWSISLGLRADGEVNLPYELFSFLKNGAATDPQEYNLGGLSVIQNTYAEFSVGYSHNLSDFVKGLTVGGRVKILAAADRLDLRADNLNLRMSSDQWNVSTDASAMVALKGLDLAQLDDNSFDFSLNSGNLGLAGMGAAFDLGAEYRLYINRFFDSVRFSASVTDLGFINYYADAMQQFRTSGNVVYEGLDGISFGKDMDLGQTFDKIKDEFMKILDLEETVPQKNVLSRIRPNLYLGVEAPFLWNRMSLGLLYNAKFGYTSTRNELTLALNMRPGNWINVGVNYSMLNAAKSIGWLLEITPRSGVGFFLGSDYTYLETATLYTVPIGSRGINLNVPLNEVNFNLRFGCYITMGNRYDDIAMEKKARRAARRADRS